MIKVIKCKLRIMNSDPQVSAVAKILLYEESGRITLDAMVADNGNCIAYRETTMPDQLTAEREFGPLLAKAVKQAHAHAQWKKERIQSESV